MNCKLIFRILQCHTFNNTYNVIDNFFLYFKNGKSNQHEIFTIAKSLDETNNYVKIIENIL